MWTTQLKPVWYEIPHVSMAWVVKIKMASNFKQFPYSMYHITKQLDDIVAL